MGRAVGGVCLDVGKVSVLSPLFPTVFSWTSWHGADQRGVCRMGRKPAHRLCSEGGNQWFLLRSTGLGGLTGLHETRKGGYLIQ